MCENSLLPQPSLIYSVYQRTLMTQNLQLYKWLTFSLIKHVFLINKKSKQLMIILGFGKWDQQDQFIKFAGNHGNNIEPKSHHKCHIPASYFRASAIKHNKRSGSVANIICQIRSGLIISTWNNIPVSQESCHQWSSFRHTIQTMGLLSIISYKLFISYFIFL